MAPGPTPGQDASPSHRVTARFRSSHPARLRLAIGVPILLALAVNVLARPERRIAVTAEAQGRHEVSNGSSDRMTMAEDSFLLLVRPATVDARSSDGAPVLRSAVE